MSLKEKKQSSELLKIKNIINIKCMKNILYIKN